jgi:hypothetical protein
MRHEYVTMPNSSVFTGMSLFSGLLPNNNSFVAVRCSGIVIFKPLPSNGRPNRLHYSGFQPPCRNIFVDFQRNCKMFSNSTFVALQQ